MAKVKILLLVHLALLLQQLSSPSSLPDAQANFIELLIPGLQNKKIEKSIGILSQVTHTPANAAPCYLQP